MFLPRISPTVLLLGIALLACALTLVALNRAAERREQDLRIRLMESKALVFACEEMTRVVGDRGFQVLRKATDAELVRVSRESGARDGSSEYVVTPTGVMLGEAVARRMAFVLMDYRNYRSIDVDDSPEPQFGLRFHDDTMTLDVLLRARPGSSHQDVWIRRGYRDGETLHSSGKKCMNDPFLQNLVEPILAR